MLPLTTVTRAPRRSFPELITRLFHLNQNLWSLQETTVLFFVPEQSWGQIFFLSHPAAKLKAVTPSSLCRRSGVTGLLLYQLVLPGLWSWISSTWNIEPPRPTAGDVHKLHLTACTIFNRTLHLPSTHTEYMLSSEDILTLTVDTCGKNACFSLVGKTSK